MPLDGARPTARPPARPSFFNREPLPIHNLSVPPPHAILTAPRQHLKKKATDRPTATALLSPETETIPSRTASP